MYPFFLKNLKDFMAYTEELMTKLAPLHKTAWNMEFAKANIKIEAHLVLNHVSYICTPKNPKN